MGGSGLLGGNGEDVAYVFTTWGQSWVCFFFLLSGFGPAYSRLSRRPQNGTLQQPGGSDEGSTLRSLLPTPNTLLKRLIAVYPAYVLSLVLALLVRALEPKAAQPLLNGGLLAFEFLLVQDWIPGAAACAWDASLQSNLSFVQAAGFKPCTADSTFVNSADWYVSCLAFLWLFENAFFRLGASAARRGLPGLSVALGGLLLWMIAWPYAGLPSIWSHVSAVWGQNTMDILAFLHVYFAGVWLAFVLDFRARSNCAPLLGGWAASCASVVLLGVFFVNLKPADVMSWFKYFGAFLPLHALIIAGVVEGDAFSRLLGLWPLPLVSTELAYPIYIAQMPVLNFVLLSPTVAALPLGTAMVVHLLVLLPVATVMAVLQKGILSVARPLLGAQAPHAPGTKGLVTKSDMEVAVSPGCVDCVC